MALEERLSFERFITELVKEFVNLAPAGPQSSSAPRFFFDCPWYAEQLRQVSSTEARVGEAQDVL